jgi:hypothetical protein
MCLLFLIAPLLKSISGSRFEQLNVFDVVSSTSAIGLISMLGLIFVLSYSTFCAFCDRESVRIKDVTDNLSKNIEAEFKNYRTKLIDGDDYIPYECINCNDPNLVSKGLNNIYPHILNTDNGLARIRGFFRLNVNGYLVQDEYPESGQKPNCHTSFYERKYFQFHLNSNDSSKLYFEPLMSWRDNRFRITVSKKYTTSILERDECTTPVVSALSFLPVSTTYFSLPPDYGFAVIDTGGLIQMHSDSTKNLAENFFESIDNPLWIKKAMVFDSISINRQYYNGEKVLLCMKRIKVEGNAHELFLILFKNSVFTEKLLLSSVINTFIISSIYILMVVGLAYFLSLIYFAGHIEKFSVFHFTWLFPNSRKINRYLFLAKVDLVALLVIIALILLADYSAALFMAFNVGLYLIFVHFIVIIKTEPWTLLQKAAAIAVFFINGIIIYFINHEYYLLKTLLQVLVYIFYLRKIMPCTPTRKKRPGEVSQSICHRNYSLFISGTIAIHYIVIPVLIFISIIYCEHDRAKYLISTGQQQQLASIPAEIKKEALRIPQFDFKLVSDSNYSVVHAENSPFEVLVQKISYSRPSDYYLSALKTIPVERAAEKLKTTPEIKSLLSKRISHWYSSDIILMTLFLMFVLLFITYSLIYMYSNRFFFFDLRSVSKVLLKKDNVFKVSPPGTPELVPPYSEEMAEYILSAENIIGCKADMKTLLDFNNEPIDYPTRLAIANHLNKQSNDIAFSSYWNSLDKLEMFALVDLAKDNFINYKNKDVLIRLMQKGFVIADPATGRIRLISYAFRQFILDWMESHPDFFSGNDVEEKKTAWAKWQLPVVIIACSILMFLFYVNTDQYNSIVSFSAGIAGALGLLMKFISTFRGLKGSSGQ